MIPFKTVSLATAVGGLMAVSGADAATTSFNLYTLTNANGRLWDMPMAGFSGADDAALGDNLASGAIPGGTAGSMTSRDPSVNPLGWTGAAAIQPTYLGGLPATWYERLDGTDSDTVTSAELLSATNPISGAGVTAITGLTVGSAAYQDFTTTVPTNWGHNADFGLLTLAEPATVTISMTSDVASKLRSGFGVWSGWESAGGSRHTVWLQNGAPALQPGDATAPYDPLFPAVESMGFTGYTRPGTDLGAYVAGAWTNVANGTATWTGLLAAGDYTVIMGGVCDRAGHVGGGSLTGVCGTTPATGKGSQLAYQMSFSSVAAPVPVPAALWLFGSALGGMGVIGRRRTKTV